MDAPKKKIVAPSKLPWKRFVFMGLPMLIGFVGIYYDKASLEFTKKLLTLLSDDKRTVAVYFVGIIIGILHFYYVGRHSSEVRSAAMRMFSGLFTSIATAIGYSLMLNSSLNFSIGVVSELLLNEKFFIDISKVDYITTLIVSLFIAYIATHLLVKMGYDSIRDINHPLTEAIPVENEPSSEDKS